MGQIVSPAVKHNVVWQTSQGFQLNDSTFAIGDEGEETHTAICMLSLREGHTQFNRLIAKFLSTFSISHDLVHGRPIILAATRNVPDPLRTGYLKQDRRLLLAPTPQELEYFVIDSRWDFHFTILAENSNNASPIRYPVFTKLQPLNY
jgi:hypothetical protein